MCVIESEASNGSVELGGTVGSCVCLLPGKQEGQAGRTKGEGRWEVWKGPVQRAEKKWKSCGKGGQKENKKIA